LGILDFRHLVRDGLLKVAKDSHDNLYTPIKFPRPVPFNKKDPEKFRISSIGQFKTINVGESQNKKDDRLILDGIGRRITIGLEEQDAYILEG